MSGLIIEYIFCWLYWNTGPKRSISLIRIIRIHLLLNTDSADFTDILAQGEASVKSDKSVFIFLNTDSADFAERLAQGEASE